MIDYRGTKRTVKLMLVNILRVEKLLDRELELDSGPGQGANTQEELEKKMAKDTINELDREIDMFLENT